MKNRLTKKDAVALWRYRESYWHEDKGMPSITILFDNEKDRKEFQEAVNKAEQIAITEREKELAKERRMVKI